MAEQDTIKKLRVLLPHWIEHNNNHIAEFRKWEGEARKESVEEIAQLLDKAISDMEVAGKSLSEALGKVGGPLEGGGGHHHHHH
ncbi:MAG: hypothetical protein HON76_15100 [Candidatus Scalindua sp.]|jgi:hypothetical protein|nr:hypothetical protein [Candidatus Scalindua sp.]MBT5307513.1 hypothetical protein [Candidatus Scalindua sp.]MBT6047666.1 hypothetical protein [Candidatus Scalindua sp.]MBT6228430.1 hypothetical protein [Candidatus Scalindua sp.]MBT6563845.1 hypothetical protein [Candidatus Scalindua sp.]